MSPGVRKIPWRMDRLPIPVFLGFLGGSDGKEYACNVEDLGLILGNPGKIPLEEGMATHSSILGWRISWREQPDQLQFMGPKSQNDSDRHTHAHILQYILQNTMLSERHQI